MAKKAQTPQNGDTLNSIAESLGTLLGNAERQWKEWQGPRDAVVKAVTDVRDRAATLLAEMGVPDAVERAKAAARSAAGGDGDKAGKKGKKKDKKAKKAKAAAENAAGKGDKKAAGKGDKKGKKAKKKDKKAASVAVDAEA